MGSELANGRTALDEHQKFRQLCTQYDAFLSGKASLAELFIAQSQRYAQAEALVCGERSFVYQELFDNAQAAAALLRSLGVGKGSSVILLLPNSIDFFFYYYGALLCGAVIIPLSVVLHPTELKHVFNAVNPEVVVAQKNIMMALKFMVQETTACVFVDIQNTKDQPVVLPASSIRRNEPSVDFSARVILFTSGSTGQPKGVMLSDKNVLINALQCNVRMQTMSLEQERSVAVLPLSHAFGHMTGLWLPLMTGASVYVMPIVKRAELERIFAEYKPTVFFGVPALYAALCSIRTLKVDSVKLFVSGADFLPHSLRDLFALLHGRLICSGYGLSEAGPVVAINHQPEQSSTIDVAPLLPGIETRVLNADGSVCAPDQIGQLWVRGENIMLGYYKDDALTQLTLQDGWLNTGDLVSVENGSLNIRGRHKEIIIYKGFNIYPQEIEQVLQKHPHVLLSVVVGIEQDDVGQIPVACVKPKPNAEIAAQEIINFCKKELTPYKVPHKIIVMENIPLQQSGKIDRRSVKNSLTHVVD